MAVPRSSDGKQFVQIDYLEGTKLTVISPNWCDRRTWYEKSVRVNNEIFSSSDGWVTYDSADTHAWVDVTHGRVTGERALRGSYAPVVQINDIAKKENDPGTVNGDFEVDYYTGKVVFNSALQSTDTVKVSYSYISGSTWTIKPDPGKKLRITEVEVQFSDDVDLKDTVSFQLYVGGQPYGSASYYQTMYDFINESNKSYPVIPRLGGSTGSWRAMSGPVNIFRWDYKATTDLKSSYGMEVRVKLENETEFGGKFAVATFYGISITE